MYSKHALIRMKQRGVTISTVEAVMDFGREYQCRKAIIYLATNSTIDRMRRYGVPMSQAEKCKGIYVVYCGGCIRTVAHCTNRFKH